MEEVCQHCHSGRLLFDTRAPGSRPLRQPNEERIPPKPFPRKASVLLPKASPKALRIPRFNCFGPGDELGHVFVPEVAHIQELASLNGQLVLLELFGWGQWRTQLPDRF